MASFTVRIQSVSTRIADEASASLERHFWRWICLSLALFLACLIARDIRDKMWTDEIFTLLMARQAGPGEIVKATIEGSDGAPPLYAIIVQSILPIIRIDPLAVRLPATLGFCGMVLCLAAFCHRRLPAVYAVFAVLLACDTCLYYSTEGRAYGLVLGGAAGALLCWQAAADGRRRALVIPLLALCLALTTALHYFAIFFLVPFFLAEMTRTRTSRRLDFAVLAAMLPAPLVLGLQYPLIAASRPFQAHFWSPASLGMIGPIYDAYLFTPLLYIFPLAVALLAVFPRLAIRGNLHQEGLRPHEWVALVALGFVPAMAVAISTRTTHAFVDRYVLWTVIGFAVIAAALLFKVARNQVVVGLTLVAFLAASVARQEMARLRHKPLLHDGETVRSELDKLPDGPQPIVIPDAHIFMELSFYAEPKLRERLIYPVNPSLDLTYLGYDTDPLILVPLSHRADLHLVAYDQLLAEYPRFILAAPPGHYWPWHLIAAGYKVVPIDSADAQPMLFQVEPQAKE